MVSGEDHARRKNSGITVQRTTTENTDRVSQREGYEVTNRAAEVKEMEDRKEYLSELFNFACVLRGEVKHLEKIKEHIVQEYVDKGLIKLIRPTYDKNEIYLITDDEWKEYQKLKEKEDKGLIGYEIR